MRFLATRCAVLDILVCAVRLVVESQEEFDAWIAKKEPKYWSAVPGSKPGSSKDSLAAPQPTAVQKDTVIAKN